MTSDGAEQWMREHIRNYHVTGVSRVGNTLTFNANGTFSTGDSHITAQGVGNGGATSTGEMAGHAAGRWSAAGGQLNMCFDAASAAGQVTVNQNGHNVTAPVQPNIPRASSNTYSCAGATFTQTVPMGHAGAVTSTYTRIH